MQVALHPLRKVEIPWHTVHIDITGNMNEKNDLKMCFICLVDAITKFVYFHNTLRIGTESSIKAVKAVVCLLGAPIRIIADQGRNFASSGFREIWSFPKN